MYALIVNGSHSDFTFNLIEISIEDKKQFVDFMRDLQFVYNDYELLAFIDNIEIYNKDIIQYHMTTARKIKEDLIDDNLRFIQEMGDKHYLYKNKEKREKLEEMLKYNFKL